MALDSNIVVNSLIRTMTSLFSTILLIFRLMLEWDTLDVSNCLFYPCLMYFLSDTKGEFTQNVYTRAFFCSKMTNEIRVPLPFHVKCILLFLTSHLDNASVGQLSTNSIVRISLRD